MEGDVPARGTECRRRPLAFVDIDGVVADVGHRVHHLEGPSKDWDAFFAAAIDDPVHPEGVAVVAGLVADHEVVFLTGRPERYRVDTERWLVRHGMGSHAVVMRPNGSRRPAATLKRGLLDRLADGREVAMVVDDDPLVIDAMRAGGRPTFEATWGGRNDALHRAQEVEGRS